MKNRVISNDLDYIMENYFDTNKEVLYLCDYDTALEILQRGKYKKEDFEYFAVELDCQYNYCSVYKYGDESFIIEFLTRKDGSLYDEYGADYTLVTNDILNEYEGIEELLESYKEIIVVKTEEMDKCTECCGLCQCQNCNEEFCNDEVTEEDIPYIELTEILNKYLDEILETDGCPQCIGNKLLEFSLEILTKFNVQRQDEKD